MASASESDYEMDSDVEEQARSLTTCSICMDKFEDPKVLPCQHTFCLKCIKQCYEASNKLRCVPVTNFPCPTCRAYCYLPPKGVEALTSDFRIGQIVDLLNAIENSIQMQQQQQKHDTTIGQSPQVFGNCSICRFQKRNQSAQVFCLQCEKSFCGNCLTQHNNTTIFREHNTINAIENIKVDGVNESKCVHHDLQIKYYCEQCQQPMCTVCVLSEHAGHPLIDHTTAFHQLAAKLKTIDVDFNAKRSELADRLDKLQQARLANAKSCQEGEAKIRLAASNAKLRLLQLENDLLAKITDLNAEKNELISRQEDKVAKALEEANKICDTINSALLSNVVESAFFEKNIKIKDQVEKYVAVEIQDCEVPKHSLVFISNVCMNLGEVVSQESNQLPSILENVDDMEFSITYNHLDVIDSIDDRPLTSHEVTSKMTSLEVISRKRDSLGNNLAKSQSTASKFARPLCSSDRIIGGLERRLSGRLSTSFSGSASTLFASRKKLRWSADNFQSCRDCCFVNLNSTWYIYASDNGSSRLDTRPGIKYFDLKGKLMGEINLRGLAGPWGLCYNSAAKSIVVADETTRAIRMIKLDSYGKCNKMITLLNCDVESASRPCEPRGLSIINGDYIITDSNALRSNNLVVFTSTAKSTNNNMLLTRKTDFAYIGKNEGKKKKVPTATLR